MKQMIIIVLVLAGLLGILQVANSPTKVENSANISAENVVQQYQQWTKLTDKPIEVPGALFTLCDMLTPAEIAVVSGYHVGEQGFNVNVYVNDTGWQTILQSGQRLFPPGSVIVKEKLIPQINSETGYREYLIVALGVMIKRDPESNLKGGTWEYLYWSKEEDKVYRGEELAHCQACHAGYSEGDSVFWPHSSEYLASPASVDLP